MGAPPFSTWAWDVSANGDIWHGDAPDRTIRHHAFLRRDGDGQYVGSLVPGPEVGRRVGWQDMPYAVAAFQRKNGECLILVEDDWRGKKRTRPECHPRLHPPHTKSITPLALPINQTLLFRHARSLLGAALMSGLAVELSASESRSSPDFARQVQPLLTETCLACHSTAKHKGDLNLERFTSTETMRQEPRVWEEVAAQVSNGEMPPRDATLPNKVRPEAREAFLAGVNAVLDEAAESIAGDPGPVVLRRLSNAEYTYTIRDLTGVPSLDPVRKFLPTALRARGS